MMAVDTTGSSFSYYQRCSDSTFAQEIREYVRLCTANVVLNLRIVGYLEVWKKILHAHGGLDDRTKSEGTSNIEIDLID